MSGATGPTSAKLQAFDATIASISAPYVLVPTNQPSWTPVSGSSVTNMSTPAPTGTPRQQMTFPTGGNARLMLQVQNPNGLSSTNFGATLTFAAYGDVAGKIRVAVTGASSATTNSQLIDYTTTLAYYSFVFTVSAADTSLTITLGGSTPGTASAQPFAMPYTTDWSMYVSPVVNNLDGDLTLLNGTLTAPTIHSTAVINSYYLDVQDELLTHPTATCYFQGPVYAQGGFTGFTGAFVDLSTNNLKVGGTGTITNLTTTKLQADTINASYTGTFGSLSATSVSAGSINTSTITSGAFSATTGFIASNGATYQVFNGTGSPFFVNRFGDTTVRNLTISGSVSGISGVTGPSGSTGSTGPTGSFSGTIVGNLNVTGQVIATSDVSCNALRAAAVFATNQFTAKDGAGYAVFNGTTNPFLVDGSGNTTVQNLTVNGQITAAVPVCVAFYGTPTCYNTAGTALTSGQSAVGIYNLRFPSVTNRNWTPSYTTNYKLAVPYTGLYSLQFTFSSAATCVFFQFITKNLGNGGEIATWTDNVLASSALSLTGSYTNSISATAYLTTSDYVCFSFYLLSGTITYYNRCCAQISLIQRAA